MLSPPIHWLGRERAQSLTAESIKIMSAGERWEAKIDCEER